MWDVAISLLDEDLQRAQALAELLRDFRSVFLYSENAEELVGLDGVEVLSSVYRDQSRLCVVFHRRHWGKTKWTRVEETAIRERGFEQMGYDFLIVVRQDDSPLPAWISETEIWADLDKLGVQGLAGVINERLKATDADSVPESIEELAARAARERRSHSENASVFNSEAGVTRAKESMDILISFLKEKVDSIDGQDDRYPLRCIERDDRVLIVTSDEAYFSLFWQFPANNTLDSAYLYLVERAERYTFRSDRRVVNENTESYFYPLVLNRGDVMWQDAGRRMGPKSPEQLGDYLLRRLVSSSGNKDDG